MDHFNNACGRSYGGGDRNDCVRECYDAVETGVLIYDIESPGYSNDVYNYTRNRLLTEMYDDP